MDSGGKEEDENSHDTLQKPRYRNAVIVVAVVWAGLFLFYAAAEGIFLAFLIPIVLVGLPLLGWTIIVYVTAERFFRYFIIRRKHYILLRRLGIISPTLSDYFLVNAKFPKSITWRFIQTVSVVFLVASAAASALPSSAGHAPLEESAPFLGSGLAALGLLMPFVFLLWVYEDSGLRRRARNNDTVGRVGALFEQFLFGGGTATTFVRFIITLNGPATLVASWAIAMFIILLPACLAVTLIFHRQASLYFVRKIRTIASANGLAVRTVRIE